MLIDLRTDPTTLSDNFEKLISSHSVLISSHSVPISFCKRKPSCQKERTKMAGNNSSSWNNQLDFSTCSEDVSCVVKTSAVSLISCLTVVGNLMSLVTLVSTKSLRNCHGYLLISLSLADLFTGLVATTSIYPTIFKKWPHGDLLCFLVASVEASTKKISPLTMTVMSIERYIAVVHPLRYSRIVTKKLVLFSIAIAWCTPIVFYIPLFLKEQI